MDTCSRHCKHYNSARMQCDLIEHTSNRELDALMNGSHEVLAEFLLSNQCRGSFGDMYRQYRKGVTFDEPAQD